MNKKLVASELAKIAEIITAAEVTENSGPYTVDMNVVKKWSSATPQYIGLVKKEIKNGGGTVDVREIKNGMAAIHGTGTHSWIMGSPYVSIEALKKV